MHRALGLPLVLALAVSGCDTKESSLGGLPPEGSGSTASELDDGGAASSDGSGLPVGAACELSFMPEATLLDLGNASCPSGMCLFASEVRTQSDASCAGAEDCEGFELGAICSPEGMCGLDPEFVAARSMCTDFCETDADCVPAEGTSCAGGFTCGPVASIGDACCQNVCICNDDYNPELQDLEWSCEGGTTEGCCDQDPLPPACGG
jgi:hypothetical protein